MDLEKEIKQDIKSKFSHLSDSDISRAYDFALSDYLLYRYPSENNRPNKDDLVITFVVSNWIKERMIDILDRAGGNVVAYSENGLSWEYASSNIDPSLKAKITPKAATPQ
uniref:Uncharacterized protein n=1 Tax=Siphoviridae sp. ctFn287 TaxID=2826215 RepID=A0A8S5LVI6_9CAUD|nr:MAG TPA: hypothetical protein [Siphoviridae sp. ctFn287]